MQKKIAAESAKKEAAYDKYMCYCENADSTLGKSIADAEAKIPQVASAIEEAAASKKQLEAELKEAQVNRVNAKDAIAEAEALRAKEAKAFAKTKADADSNIGALSKPSLLSRKVCQEPSFRQRLPLSCADSPFLQTWFQQIETCLHLSFQREAPMHQRVAKLLES